MTAPDYLQGNIDGWNTYAGDYVEPAEEAWDSRHPFWGIWQTPESKLGLLPDDMTGMRCIELGCGTAYVSAWMSRRGGRVTAIDPTPNQLATARRLQSHHGDDFEIREGFAEQTGLADASFDFAISEYGAALWADPYAWVPEAARILKPGGQLVLLTNSPLMVMCVPEHDADGATGTQLLRPYFGMHRINWPDDPGQTEFQLTHGAWIELFAENGLSVERLEEIQVPASATSRFTWGDPVWASQWPTEDAWVTRKKG